MKKMKTDNNRPTVPGHIWQHECDGWYIYSNISNSQKASDLQLISDHYHLGLKIEEGKRSLSDGPWEGS